MKFILCIILFFAWGLSSFALNPCGEAKLILIDESRLRLMAQGSQFEEELGSISRVYASSLSLTDFEEILSLVVGRQFGTISCLTEMDLNLVKVRTNLSPSNGREMFILRSGIKGEWRVLDETLRDWYIIK